MLNGTYPRLLVALIVGYSASTAGRTAERDEPVVASLQAALAKIAGHARDSLDQKDYKSLAQSAGSVRLLAELIKSKSDDPAWQAAIGACVSAASEEQLAAREEDSARCKAALDALDKAATAAIALRPTGQPQALPKAPPIRSLMLTMDGIQADAKIALITGNVEAAKNQAFALAELSRLVSNSRTGDKWSALASDFTKSAVAAATSTDTDPKSVRQLFRGVSQQCETCHESSRTR